MTRRFVLTVHLLDATPTTTASSSRVPSYRAAIRTTSRARMEIPSVLKVTNVVLMGLGLAVLAMGALVVLECE